MARPHHAVVHDVERVQAQVPEVVMDAGSQVFAASGRLPRLVGGRQAPSLVTITNPAG